MYRLYRIIDFFRYNIPYGVRNLIAWFPLIWSDRNWDWVFLARIMEFKLRRMSEHSRKYACHVGAGRDARDMLICAKLLQTIIDDDCGDCVGRDGILAHEERMAKSQLLLGKIIGKRMRYWWD